MKPHDDNRKHDKHDDKDKVEKDKKPCKCRQPHSKDRKHKPTISLLVPFRTEDPHRHKVFAWLKRYWAHELPEAEIVEGHDWGMPFSKTCAVNDAASRARGDIFVILDADAYLPGEVIRLAAARINRARRHNHPLWFVPYRRVYRLTVEATCNVLHSDPRDPYRFPTPPDDLDVESTQGSAFGHRFGALIQIVPREAFELVGGMDPRFRAWGGEDVSFVRALDTLYGKHKTTDNDVLHLWHPKIGTGWATREWDGQKGPRENDQLAIRYNQATGDRVRMRRLVNEGHKVKCKTDWWHRVLYLILYGN